MTNLQFLELLPIAIYLITILIIGLNNRAANSSLNEFVLGGRRLTLPGFIATLVTTWYGGILGVGEFTYLYGISNWVVFGLPYYLFAFIFAFYLAPKIQSSPHLSIPEHFYQCSGNAAGVISAIFTFFMILPAPYVLMVGFLLNWISGWPLWICIIIGTLFSMIYVLSGGFQAVVRTDKLQFLLMFGGFIVLTIVLISEYGHLPFLRSHLPALHLTWHGGNSLQTIIAWFFIAAWTFIDPGFHQRCAAAKTPQIARRGILISIGFWFLFDLLTTTCGLYARALLAENTITPALSFPILGHQILPPLLSGLFLVGLLATIMSTVDSFALLSAITIGYDVIGRHFKKTPKVLLIKLGLAVTAMISIVLAIAVPSVINLWLLIGNIFIPPMLLPVISFYSSRINPSKRIILLNLCGSFLLSFGWLILSVVHSSTLAQLTFYMDIPPMYPGLLASAIIFSAGYIYSGKPKY
jgi:SSS family solute:Na+ symporter